METTKKTETPQEMIDKFKGKALNYVIIVKEVVKENVTASGYDMSGIVDKNEKYKQGVVISMGEGCPKDGIKAGDVVLYDGYKASPLTIYAETYVSLLYGDLILAL